MFETTGMKVIFLLAVGLFLFGVLTGNKTDEQKAIELKKIRDRPIDITKLKELEKKAFTLDKSNEMNDEQVDRIVDKWVAYENEIKEVRHQKAIKIEAFDRASRNVQMK
ncbi:MAG: hypothetical protein U9R16_04420, partial [Campylobacterota bacterium]|nr:hypothetical protein [Campylobacterota bacterium]